MDSKRREPPRADVADTEEVDITAPSPPAVRFEGDQVVDLIPAGHLGHAFWHDQGALSVVVKLEQARGMRDNPGDTYIVSRSVDGPSRDAPLQETLHHERRHVVGGERQFIVQFGAEQPQAVYGVKLRGFSV